ncbi:MAG: IS110 family transposase [Candidatus Sumerlaeaceae bacterium]|nr:IS110 family transposase [Candidatus Sumerlaeaceae bacterium]
MKDRYTYVGLDVHKKSVSYCAKRADGTIIADGQVAANRKSLRIWERTLPRPWRGAMEATLFTGWIYDFLKPRAEELKVAHPLMMRAIAASKKKNDRVDAEKLADALRANLVPECYMAPTGIRELRRVLRFRNLIVSLAVKMKNKCAGLLMEVGAKYNKTKLHRKGYFSELLEGLSPHEVPDSVKAMLRMARSQVELFGALDKKLVRGLEDDKRLAERVERLQTIRGVGSIMALTWALEVGEPERLGSVRKACSYCGLTSAQSQSGASAKRLPISKQRNKHLQRVLIETAKLAPRWNAQLAAVHERELARGNNNRATLAVARKLVAFLLAVDKSGKAFEEREVMPKN